MDAFKELVLNWQRWINYFLMSAASWVLGVAILFIPMTEFNWSVKGPALAVVSILSLYVISASAKTIDVLEN